MPLSSIRICINDTASRAFAGSAWTNEAGVYTVGGLSAGSYHVHTQNWLGYIDQVYNGVTCPDGICNHTLATPVTVAADATTSGINFALAVGGVITGTVSGLRADCRSRT